MRELRTIGKVTDVKVIIFDKCKYTMLPETVENAKTINYSGVSNLEIVTGEDAKEIEGMTDGSCMDDFHEYLVLHFEDGSESTFRNSYTDMFLR